MKRFSFSTRRSPRPWRIASLILLHVACGAACLQAADEPKVFQVSSPANKAELINVFAAVEALETKGNAEGETFEISQRLSATRFLVYKTRIYTRVIRDSLAASGGGGRVSSSESLIRAGDTLYCLETQAEHSMVSGDKITLKVAPEGADLYEYTSVLGAAMSVRVIKELKSEPVPELTKEIFVQRLRAGETWILKQFQQLPCHACSGKGELGAMKKHAPCPTCAGKGSTPTDLLVKW